MLSSMRSGYRWKRTTLHDLPSRQRDQYYGRDEQNGKELEEQAPLRGSVLLDHYRGRLRGPPLRGVH